MLEYQSSQNTMEQLKNCCKQLIKTLEPYENHPDRQCLKEIQSVIKNKELDDFEAVDEIVTILLNYGWDTGARHNFG